jgi:hypothetical protein
MADCFENPRGHQISSQDITRLLDRIDTDSILTFYKEWLACVKKTSDCVVYDLISISWSGKGINIAKWDYNRDEDKLNQVNYALLCARITGLPLFAWPLDCSLSDTSTLQNTLQFLDKLGYNPGCLMMDRGFESQKNMTYMLGRGHTFLQALRLNSGWLHEIIEAGRMERLSPDSVLKVKETEHTTRVLLFITKKVTKKGAKEEIHVMFNNGLKSISEQIGMEVVSQHGCSVQVLFCQDLVGKQLDRFMESLELEHDRLINDEQSAIGEGFKRYLKIEKKETQDEGVWNTIWKTLKNTVIAMRVTSASSQTIGKSLPLNKLYASIRQEIT